LLQIGLPGVDVGGVVDLCHEGTGGAALQKIIKKLRPMFLKKVARARLGSKPGTLYIFMVPGLGANAGSFIFSSLYRCATAATHN
jgi:hypothetical protein